MNYFERSDFDGVYLEDSYVLDITEVADTLTFRMDFVLTESHPRYQPPPPSEQYCYVKGALTFDNLFKIEWLERSSHVYTDASGEQDLGNMDYLIQEEDQWHTGGDWGEVIVHTTHPPRITLDSR